MVRFLLQIEAMRNDAKFCMMLKVVISEQNQKLNKTRIKGEKIQPKKENYEGKLTLLVILLDG